jgi:hypothetical protein
MTVAFRDRLLARSALLCSTAMLALWCAAAPAHQAQETITPADGEAEEDTAEIVVMGTRGSAITDVAPVTTLDETALSAIGATTIGELLQAIRGSTQAADGGEPIFLLNSQRVSGYQEIGSLPPEAIEKVEVLPEQAALKFGFPPTRRVVNFITKSRFRQIEVRAGAGTTTEPGSGTEKANLGYTRLRKGGRLTLGLEVRRTDPLLVSDRDIDPDPDIPFDEIGNITGIGGGEIDPALSAAAGQIVTIAPVPALPADQGSLGAFSAAANEPRLFGLGPYRTLVPGNDGFKAEAVIADRIGETMAGSLTLTAEQSRDRNLYGPARVRLIVPGDNPYSPFDRPVILNRYLTETDPLRQRETTTTLNAGLTLRGAVAGWRWDFTGVLNQKQVDGRSEQGVDAAEANAAIAAGANPFAPLNPSLLTARMTDETRLRTRNAGAKTVVTNTPIQLPAGRVSVTATVEAERLDASSSSRGSNASELELGRTRIEGGVALDVPIASRRDDVLALMGDLSVNGSANVRQVGGFGSLHDRTLGLAWSPIEGVQLLANVRRSAAAPDMAQQLTPSVQVENAPVFDYGTGRTELVTLILGGNPDLLAERRLVRSLSVNVKPFPKRELRLAATYEATTIRDQTGTVYSVNPLTEAILPDLFVRDDSGRLVSVAFRPTNFYLEHQRSLSFTINASGRIGKAPPASPPGAKGGDKRPAYYFGIGPTIKLSDRLQLRPGTPELDLLAGDTIRGWGMARTQGFAYGGLHHGGSGLTFSAWYQTESRVRSDDPDSDLRFSPIVKLNLNAYVGLGALLKEERWAKGLRLGVEVSNLTNARQRATDRDGDVPNRFQSYYLDPIGRTVTFTLRKLF